MTQYFELRKNLHAHPELSGEEALTQRTLLDFLKRFNPTQVIPLARKKALLVEFDSGSPGPHLVFRADMDALPIQEAKKLAHHSQHPGVSHKCGHDGHMTLACTLPEIWLSSEVRTGKLGLLFQHAEETALGAKEIVADPKFRSWNPSLIFGLHNLPGFATDEVVLADDVFSCASVGVRLTFTGHSAHAAEPDKALSPFPALVALRDYAQDLVSSTEDEDFFLSTVVHLKLGEENFGITPGNGKICFTLRAKHTERLLEKKGLLLEKAQALARDASLRLGTEEFDFFPATSNSKEVVNLLRIAAAKTRLKTITKDFPFRWSEDFGYYETICPVAFFGIGNGVDSRPLHHPEYDFNEGAILTLQRLFKHVLNPELPATE